MANVFCTGQITADQLEHVKEQIAKQTIQPTWAIFYIDDDPATGIDNRRRRIAENHQYLVELVKRQKCDYVWQIEGDSVIPPDALEKLISTTKKLKDFGFITGVQVGRHGVYCIGAWHIDNDRKRFKSVDYRRTGLIEIDASGWYCMLAKKDVWLKGRASWTDERYGPDVVWGLTIKEPKYIDMAVKIGHKTSRGIISVDDKSTCIAEFTYKNSENRWIFKEIG